MPILIPQSYYHKSIRLRLYNLYMGKYGFLILA